MLIIAWKELESIVKMMLPTLPEKAVEPISRVLTEIRAELGMTHGAVFELLSILRRASERFDTVFGHFGRDAFFTTVLPAAIHRYGEDARCLAQALDNILENGEDVTVRQIDVYFSANVPRAIALYGFDLFELRDTSLRQKMPAGGRVEHAEEVDALLSPETIRSSASRAIRARLAEVEAERRAEIEELIKDGSKEPSPFFRYLTEQVYEEERLHALLPELFRSKLAHETDPEEAASLLKAIESARQDVARLRNRARARRSDIGEVIADNALFRVEQAMQAYIDTPSKAYSVKMRHHLQCALGAVRDKVALEERLTETGRLEDALGSEIRGVLVRANLTLDNDDTRVHYFPTLSPEIVLAGLHEARVEVKGSVITITDKEGRIHARRRDMLTDASRVNPRIITVLGTLHGLLKLRTDKDGALALEETPAGKTLLGIPLPDGKDMAGQEFVLKLDGEEAHLETPSRSLTITRHLLREGLRAEPVHTEDLFLFRKDGCNIFFYAKGQVVNTIGAPTIAQRLAEVIAVLEAVYPGRRLEFILPETLEIVAAAGLSKPGTVATSDEHGVTHLSIEGRGPVEMAASLVHEDAHSLCAKVIGSVDRYVSEEMRGRKFLIGSKTPGELVEESLKEIFARLIQSRFFIDVLRAGLATPNQVRETTEELLHDVTLDLAHLESKNLLSEKGRKLTHDFRAEHETLGTAWKEFRQAPDPVIRTLEVAPLSIERAPWESELNQAFVLDALAEGVCTQALEKYGLLPSPRRAMLQGLAPRALLPPAAQSLLERESLKRRLERKPKTKKPRERAPRPPSLDQIHDEFTNWLAEHPEHRTQAEEEDEAWKLKLRDAERAAKGNWTPADHDDE